MQRRTLSRFDEILKVFRKYDFDKFLGQTTRNKIINASRAWNNIH